MNRIAAFVFVALLAGGCGGGETPETEARRWLELEIERPGIATSESADDEEGAAEFEDENGLITRTYIVPPGFLTSAPVAEGGDGPLDPFAVRDRGHAWKLMTPREVLEAYGVVFGPGATAHYARKKSTMRVTQIPEQMELVEAIFGSIIGSGPGDWSNITVRFEIYELLTAQAVELERSADEHFEHTPELNAVLEGVKSGQAEIVTTANLLTRSGQRTIYQDGIERPARGDLIAEKGDDGESTSRWVRPVQRFGTLIEADCVVGPDSRTLDILFQIDHHISVSGPESGEVRYLKRSMRATETSYSGTVKLLGSWPASDAAGNRESDRSRIVFLKATTVSDLQREER